MTQDIPKWSKITKNDENVKNPTQCQTNFLIFEQVKIYLGKHSHLSKYVYIFLG